MTLILKNGSCYMQHKQHFNDYLNNNVKRIISVLNENNKIIKLFI